MKRYAVAFVLLLLASGAGAYLISSAPVGGFFAFEGLPGGLRPLTLRVDAQNSDLPASIVNPLGITQTLMDTWNAVPGADNVFGTAVLGGNYTGGSLGVNFGIFDNGIFEVAWDPDGTILGAFGGGLGTLGLTVKSIVVSTGEIRDLVVIINTHPTALPAGPSAPGRFRATLLHELGHATGLSHTPVGIAHQFTHGLEFAVPEEFPTMYAFSIPGGPAEGGTLEADDRAGLRTRYSQGVAGLGSISGTVTGISGAAVNEIAVRAVSGTTPNKVHVGVLTNSNGRDRGEYQILNVPPGEYRVLIETVNGRGAVTGPVLDSNGLGSRPFVLATDEYWVPGDTYDPAVDTRGVFATVQVRAERDTGAIDFVLNATPIRAGDTLQGNFNTVDSRVMDAFFAFHPTDYFVFDGQAGQPVTITATAAASPNPVTPQLRLLRPNNFSVEAADEPPPPAGSATINTTLGRTGIYTIAVLSGVALGPGASTGDYSLSLSGSGGSLPAPPVVTAPALALGVANGPDASVGNPTCPTGMLQIELQAGSHEELWVDAITLRASGSGDDAQDIARVRIYLDNGGNGRVGAGDRLVGEGTFSADDGTLTIGGLNVEVDAGGTNHLLVVYEVTVTSVMSATAGLGATLWWAAAAALLLALVRPVRRTGAPLLLLLALSLSSCGGGADPAPVCANPAFDAGGVSVDFQVRVDPGDITAVTPTTNPSTPIANLPATTLRSGTLTVSN